MFGLPKNIALKIAEKANTSCKKTFSILKLRLIQQKIENGEKNGKNCNILGSKTPKNDILTLNYSLSSHQWTWLRTSNETWCPLSFTCLSRFESSMPCKKLWKKLNLEGTMSELGRPYIFLRN